MTPSRLQYLLEKYLNGTATVAELQEYDHWYHTQPGEEAAFSQEETETVYTRIAAGIRRKKIFYLARMAAVVALLITAAGSLWLFYQRQPAAPAVAAATKPVRPDTITIRNTTDNKRDINLPDGSLATLYKGGELRFANPFGVKDRVVLLEGKGFFHVTKNAPQPFTVINNGVSTTALGTSFTIAHVNNKVKVQLHTGKVMVKANRKTLYMTPGQQVVCDVHTGTVKLAPAMAAVNKGPVMTAVNYGSLRGFSASFDQTPLSGVFDTIATGYHIRISGQAAACQDIVFSGVIRDTDSLAQVLYRIAMLHDLKITSTHTGYRIEKNH